MDNNLFMCLLNNPDILDIFYVMQYLQLIQEYSYCYEKLQQFEHYIYAYYVYHKYLLLFSKIEIEESGLPMKILVTILTWLSS